MGGPDGQLLFTYRDGSRGSGDQIYNMYDPATQKWSRLLDTPLTSGEGKCNAYLNGPGKGPDGYYHLCWVWRDTGDCATNHDVCYARSKDLRNWETATGKSLTLPITPATADGVDPVPAGGGLLNGNVKLGFDLKHRVIVSYHKYDADGNTQIYNARLEDGAWKTRQLTDWKYRWNFSGGGTIVTELRLSGVTLGDDGALRLNSTHKKLGAGTDPEVRYALEWKTLGPNRDHPREGPPPPPAALRVLTLRK